MPYDSVNAAIAEDTAAKKKRAMELRFDHALNDKHVASAGLPRRAMSLEPLQSEKFNSGFDNYQGSGKNTGAAVTGATNGL